MTILGAALRFQGELPRARAVYEEVLEQAERQRQAPELQSMFAYTGLGDVARREGDVAAARALYDRFLTLPGYGAHVVNRGLYVALKGVLAADQGDWPRAAQLLAAVPHEALLVIRMHHAHHERDYLCALEAAHHALGEDAFAAVAREGRGLSLEQAVAYALTEGPGDAA